MPKCPDAAGAFGRQCQPSTLPTIYSAVRVQVLAFRRMTRRTNSSSAARQQAADQRRREQAKIELLEADIHLSSEIKAFDVVVNGALIGRWVMTVTGGSVTWTDGREVPTGSCEGDERQIIEAVRASAPILPADPANANPMDARPGGFRIPRGEGREQ